MSENIYELSWENDLDVNLLEIVNNSNEIITEDKNNDENDICPDIPDEITNNTVQTICIDDIIETNIENIQSWQLIDYEWKVAKYVQELLEEKNNINKNEFCETLLSQDKLRIIIDYLLWISDCCKVLAKRIGQNIHEYTTHSTPSIIRSSYNFCGNTSSCKLFYQKTDYPTCSEHHFVHSILKYDIDSVIQYLKYVLDENIVIKNDEYNNIYSSIKTICFVTNHMRVELWRIDFVTKNGSEQYHRNNPFDIKKKKLNVAIGKTSKNTKNNNFNNHKNKKNNSNCRNSNRYNLLKNIN